MGEVGPTGEGGEEEYSHPEDGAIDDGDGEASEDESLDGLLAAADVQQVVQDVAHHFVYERDGPTVEELQARDRYQAWLDNHPLGPVVAREIFRRFVRAAADDLMQHDPELGIGLKLLLEGSLRPSDPEEDQS